MKKQAKKKLNSKLEFNIQKISKVGSSSINGGDAILDDRSRYCTLTTCPRYTREYTNCL